MEHFRPTPCWENMFYRLAASLKFAFKWFSMFGLAQTFSRNILPYEQMFGYLATSANKAYASEKKVTYQRRNFGVVDVFSAVIRRKR